MAKFETDLAPDTHEFPQEMVGVSQDKLTIEMADKDVADTIDLWVKLSTDNFNEMDIPMRQQTMRKYTFGKQIDETKFKKWQAPFVDNLIHRNLRYLIPVALSRMPDIIIKPGPTGDELVAEKLGEAITKKLKKDDFQFSLRMAFKHRPIWLIGAIKSRWNPEKGRQGDFEFDWVHPQNLVLDHTARDHKVQGHQFIGEYIERTAGEWMRLFPEKADEFMEELGWDETDKKTGRKMMTPIKGLEFWFTYYERRLSPLTGKTEYQRIEAVVWKYKKVVFDKMKNPNWDWLGEERWFSYDEETENLRALTQQQLRQSILTGAPAFGQTQQRVYRNFLKNPLKPYILVGYEQWGEAAYDMTSEVEQVILLQDNYNKRGRQITEQGDRAKGKHVFSTASGLKKKDIQKIDMSNPNQDLLVKGKINEVHTFIPGTPPDASQFKNQEQLGRSIDAEMGANAPLRGEIESDVGITNQIAKQGNISVQDDIVEQTINAAAKEAAMHSVHYVKLRYTPQHFVDLIGPLGGHVHQQITADHIDDGFIVETDASGTDKLQLKREAFERMDRKATDLLSFYKDTGVSNPERRAEMLLTQESSIELYLQKYVLNKSSQDIAQQLTDIGRNQQGQTAGFTTTPAGGQPGANQLGQANAGFGTRQLPTPNQAVALGVGAG